MNKEKKWIKLIQKKADEKAANELVSFYYQPIYAFVYKQTLNKELSMDLTQDIFISMLQSIQNFDTKKSSFKTWLYMYVLGIALLFLVAFISSLAPNYMTNIGVQIPLAFVLFGIGKSYLVQDITNLFLPKYFLSIALVFILAGSAVIFVLKWKKESIKDIL
ncbi:ECF subfamily RNA polymerase sigma factor [Bacillus methanolicus PB1]|uniref:ECF subfamily RNA polymerase sigma factor n=1 Tax=Bacillus methanolicus PB1 TaxID=997296 RepID=I3DUZ4_BACMT|nr:sigma-70 family RNA polymerase sigma factor [Bacillus methanolicus]EIJ78065.1 ECF subfamily RNA polymerase sigma factor [Bacillus methanolicus PB1]